MITKQIQPEDLDIKKDSREVIVVASTDSIDRDGEVVKATGLLKKNYAGLPLLMGHDDHRLPIGVIRWAKPDSSKRKVLTKYYIHDKSEEARITWELVKDGILNFHSIRFDPDEKTSGPPTSKELPHYPHWKGAKTVFRNWELLELSVVNIPANPEAQTLAVAKGYTCDKYKFLGDHFAAIEDCWDWTEEETIVVPEAPKFAVPKQCRSLRDIQKELMQTINKDEILAKLRGKA